PAYHALESRMEDFRNNQIQKILADNLTDLNRAKRNLLSELPEITEEVTKNDADIEKLIAFRKKVITQRDNLYTDAGISNPTEISLGSESAEKILNKIRSLNSSKTTIERRLQGYDADINFEERNLDELERKKATFISVQE